MPDVDLTELSQQLQRAGEEWEKLFRESIRPVEQLILKLQRERFDKLSQGLTAWGDQWPRNRVQDARRRAIGVISGNLRNSLTARVTASSGRVRIRLRYTSEYAAAFDKLRKLLPERIPREWADQINALLETQLAKFEDVLRARGLID